MVVIDQDIGKFFKRKFLKERKKANSQHPNIRYNILKKEGGSQDSKLQNRPEKVIVLAKNLI